MIAYAVKYADKLLEALLEHIELVLWTLMISIVIATILTIFSLCVEWMERLLLHLSSLIYSIPSLALFALLIPFTGLGKVSAIIVLVIYNQYILLRNFITGMKDVEPAILEAAKGIGMNTLQIITKVQLPLSKKALFTGIRLAVISTIGIATIAAVINAGGLGSILFDGLRTMNVNKILWGSILSAGLAILINYALSFIENRL